MLICYYLLAVRVHILFGLSYFLLVGSFSHALIVQAIWPLHKGRMAVLCYSCWYCLTSHHKGKLQFSKLCFTCSNYFTGRVEYEIRNKRCLFWEHLVYSLSEPIIIKMAYQPLFQLTNCRRKTSVKCVPTRLWNVVSCCVFNMQGSENFSCLYMYTWSVHKTQHIEVTKLSIQNFSPHWWRFSL